MKNKTFLVLMEQLVMILVFALAAALCLQAFVFTHRTSLRHEQRDRAVLEAQNAAEAMKSGWWEYFSESGTTFSQDSTYVLLYDAEWQPVREEATYILTATPLETGSPYLWKAAVSVRTAAGDVLISLPVAGQKEAANG